MALICGFAAIFGAAAPAGAATESFGLSSAAVSGQSSVTWQGPPVNPPGTPNVFPDATNPIALNGQIDPSTGDISGASLYLPPLPQPEQEGENTTFTFTEVNPSTATGTFDASTGAVTLNDTLTLTFVGTGTANITCVSTPINVTLSGTWDSATQNVTLAASGFTIPDFGPGSATCPLASPSLNASPGGVAGSVGNAFSLALHGQFAPGLPTTTTLATSVPSPQLAGTSVTLTATVVDPSAAGTPTGTVNFEDNGQSLGVETLSASGTTGTATADLTTTTLPQTANQQLVAIYSGDTSYAGSTSTAVSYTIQALPTISSTFPSQVTTGTTTFPTPTPFTLTVTDPAGGATYANNLFMYLGVVTSGNGLDEPDIQLSYQDQAGNWCPLTLSKTPKPPTGSPLPPTNSAVYFSGLGTPPCGFTSAFSLSPGTSFTLNMEAAFDQSDNEPKSYTGPLSFSTALETGSCTSSSSCTAVAPLTGTSAVTSQALSTVLPPNGAGTVPTTITSVTSGSTILSGYEVKVQATVAPTSAAKDDYYELPGPTGTVQFFVDGQFVAAHPLQVAGETGGTSSSSNPGVLTPGTHTLTAVYSGDLVYAPNSASFTFTVVAGPPSGTPYVCASIVNGGSIGNYNAYVTAAGAGVPTAAASGTAVNVSGLSVTLNVDPGAEGNPGNAEAAAAGFNDLQSGNAISLSPGSAATNPGMGTFVADPTNTQAISTWSGLSTTVTVNGSPGSTVPIGVGSISFDFDGELGDSLSCTPVSAPAVIGTVTISGTTLAVSPSGSALAGAPVTLTATVAPLPPAPTPVSKDAVAPGQVDFYDGSTYLGTANVAASGAAAATASLTTSTLSVGDHQLTATWSGYSGVPGSTSNTVDYTVGTATTTALASSANPANPANAVDPVTFTATVSPPLGALTQPTGDVSFTSDGNPISGCSNQPLSMASPPTATCTTSFAAGTTHSIVATYSGDGTYLGSASDPLTQTMLPGTNTTILSTKDPSPPGNVTFWSGVSPSSGKGATPTGTVAFTIDGATYKACNAQPLGPGGGASCTVSFKAGTTHKVFATYAGSSSYSGSKSSTITQTVTGSKSSTTPKATGGSATLASGKSLTAGQSIATGSYKLVMQSDGNLVEYQGSKALWASDTSGHSGTGVVMQKDGNLVEYQSGKAIWASNTSGHAGSHLTLQGSDGNVVIYTPANKAVWATGT